MTASNTRSLFFCVLLVSALLFKAFAVADVRRAPTSKTAASNAVTLPAGTKTMTTAQQARQRQQVQRVDALVRRASAQFEPEVRRLPQAAEMARALQRVAKAKNPRIRRRLVTEYQRRYRKAYQSAMARVNLRSGDLLAQARAQAPDLEVRSSDGIGLQITVSGVGGFGADENAAPQPLTVIQTITDFLEEMEVSTGAGSGGQVDFESDGVEVSAYAIVLGQLRAAGALKKRVTVPSEAQAPELKVDGGSGIVSHAVGVVGVAGTTCITQVAIENADDADDAVSFLYHRQDTMAPLLWVASNSERIEFDQRIQLTSGQRWDFSAEASCLSFAGASPTTGGIAEITDLNVELSYQQ